LQITLVADLIADCFGWGALVFRFNRPEQMRRKAQSPQHS